MPSATEGSASTRISGEFNVHRAGPTTAGIVVSYTVAGTAVSGTHFNADGSFGTSVEIPAGETDVALAVDPINDETYSGNKTVAVTLTSARFEEANTTGRVNLSTVTAQKSAMVTIRDDEGEVPTVGVTTKNILEGATGQFEFTRSGDTVAALTVHFALSGTAQATTNYTAPANSYVTFGAGQSQVILSIPTVNKATKDGNLTLTATIAEDTSAYSLSLTNYSATLTIQDIDSTKSPVSIAASTSVAKEGGQSGKFTLTRGIPTTYDLAVKLSWNGTATKGTDFQLSVSSNGTTTSLTSADVTIPAGLTSVEISVDPITYATPATGVMAVRPPTKTVEASIDAPAGSEYITDASTDTATVTIRKRLSVPWDINVDRKSDLVLQSAATGGNATVYKAVLNTSTGAITWTNANTATPGTTVTLPTGYALVGTGDFNSDGQEDYLLRQAATPFEYYIWPIGTAPTGTTTPSVVAKRGVALTTIGNKRGKIGGAPAGDYQYQGVGDFNFDGYSDIVVKEAATGIWSVWFMQELSKIGGGPLDPVVSSTQSLVGVADFDDNGYSDFLFFDSSSNSFSIWLTPATAGASTTLAAGAWSTDSLDEIKNSFVSGASYVGAAVGDFDGDGKPDIYVRHASRSQNIWFMNGPALSGSVFALEAFDAYTPGLNYYSFAGAGDFNGDGMCDLLSKYSTSFRTWRSKKDANTGQFASPGKDGPITIGGNLRR